MLWCTACKTEHDEDDFYRCSKSKSGFRAECKAAIRARQRAYKAKKHDAIPTEARPHRVWSRGRADFDAAVDAGRCLWRVYWTDACLRPATWRSMSSRWQTCDEHRNQPDRPIGSKP